MGKLPIIFILCSITIFCMPTTGHAYLDPGIGSVILQGLAAGAVAIATFWKQIIAALRNLFKKKDK
jgi:hypothetical protein